MFPLLHLWMCTFHHTTIILLYYKRKIIYDAFCKVFKLLMSIYSIPPLLVISTLDENTNKSFYLFLSRITRNAKVDNTFLLKTNCKICIPLWFYNNWNIQSLSDFMLRFLPHFITIVETRQVPYLMFPATF